MPYFVLVLQMPTFIGIVVAMVALSSGSAIAPRLNTSVEARWLVGCRTPGLAYPVSTGL